MKKMTVKIEIELDVEFDDNNNALFNNLVDAIKGIAVYDFLNGVIKIKGVEIKNNKKIKKQ